MDDILNLFTSNEELRQWMLTPFTIKNFVYATDAYTMIRMPKKESNYSNLKNGSVSQISEELFNKETIKEIVVKTEDLKKDLLEIPLVDQYVNCDKNFKCHACDGDGEVNWEYGSYTRLDDCPECEGEGTIIEPRRQKTGRKEIDSTYLISFLDKAVKPKYITRILKAAEYYEAKSITISLKSILSSAPIHFSFYDIECLCMPFILNNSEFKVITSYNEPQKAWQS